MDISILGWIAIATLGALALGRLAWEWWRGDMAYTETGPRRVGGLVGIRRPQSWAGFDWNRLLADVLAEDSEEEEEIA